MNYQMFIFKRTNTVSELRFKLRRLGQIITQSVAFTALVLVGGWEHEYIASVPFLKLYFAEEIVIRVCEATYYELFSPYLLG